MSHEPTLTVWMYYFGLFILCSTESHRGRIVCASIAYETREATRTWLCSPLHFSKKLRAFIGGGGGRRRP